MIKVMVLGATGMLGSAVERVLSSRANIEVIPTSRSPLPGYLPFEATSTNLDRFLLDSKPDWIVNCVGIIKPYINDSKSSDILNALQINAIFPHSLAEISSRYGYRVIQIATDCVFSGRSGSYVETSLHDATDVYGKSKSLGEALSDSIMHIRASIIGPEIGRSSSLLEWLKNQPKGASINGFIDHMWNGVTTDAFANVCAAIIDRERFEPGIHHLIPADKITKYQLLEIIRFAYHRDDIQISPVSSGNAIDRTLQTLSADFNISLWSNSTFGKVPSIEEMVNSQALAAN